MIQIDFTLNSLYDGRSTGSLCAMPQKDQVSIRLSAEVWAQVDDLDGYFGNGRSEVTGFILRSWFSQNQAEIRDTKSRIDSLMKKQSAGSGTKEA